MSTELSNGVIIPEEYSDDWYDEMSINLRKLNDVITAASDNATNIQRLDTDKANQTDLTALTSRVSQNETDIIALQTAVSGALKREIVQTLPTEDISTTTIYMIRNSESSGTNIYDEYMYINSQWELIGTSATDFSNYYTKNETDNLLSGKVDNSTLGSYYTKTESDNLLSAKANQTDLTSLSGRVTQNETDITALQTAVSGALKREIVQSLPTQDISTTTIYMIRNTTTSGDNIYDEYMYINNLWELIGTSATDFSNYYTKTEIDTLLSGKANDSDVVHKSGNETVGGSKTFSDTATFVSVNLEDIRWKSLVNQTVDLNDCYIAKAGAISGYYTTDISSGANISNKAINTAFTMISLTTRRVSASDYQVRQVFYGSGAKYIRTCSNGTWSAWIKETDKYVTTDTAQTISETKTFTNTIKSKKEIELTGSRLAYILPEFSAGYSGLSLCTYGSNGAIKIGAWKVDDNDNTKHVLDASLGYLNVSTGSVNNVNIAYITPRNATDSKLGDSVNKWKSFNGLEPSSLSLPSGNASNFIDISSYFANTGSGDTNSYTASANGWIYLHLGDISGCQATVLDANNNRMWGQTSTGSVEQITIPILKGQTLTTQWNTGSTVTVATARFIPCLGNI